MHRSSTPRCTLFYSLALICIPLAFQLAAAVPAGVPDTMRLLLVLSIWATLSFASLLIAVLIKVAVVLSTQWQHGQRRGWCR